MPGTFSAQARPRDGGARTDALRTLAFIRVRDFPSNPGAAQNGYVHPTRARKNRVFGSDRLCRSVPNRTRIRVC